MPTGSTSRTAPRCRSNWGLPIGRAGRIEVNGDTRVVGFENIFAIGDASIIVDNPLPQLAQPAIQTGKHAARQIARLYRGLETETSATSTRAPWRPSAVATRCWRLP